MAARKDLVIEQGATFLLDLVLEDPAKQPVDLTGATAQMQGRLRVGAGTTLFDWSVSGGQITIDGPAGAVKVSVPASQTRTLSFDVGVYDLEITESDGTVLRVLEGVVELSKEVTR